MFTVVSATQTVELVLLAVAVGYSWATADECEFEATNFLFQLVVACLFWGVWALGRRFTGQYEYMIVACFVVI